MRGAVKVAAPTLRGKLTLDVIRSFAAVLTEHVGGVVRFARTEAGGWQAVRWDARKVVYPADERSGWTTVRFTGRRAIIGEGRTLLLCIKDAAKQAGVGEGAAKQVTMRLGEVLYG